MTHWERANQNFAIAIVAFAASLLLFGCAPAIFANVFFVALCGGHDHAVFLLAITDVLTITLTIAAFARALIETIHSRQARLDDAVDRRRQREIEERTLDS
jgi:ACR3 family arsenite efflux pump ArsB